MLIVFCLYRTIKSVEKSLEGTLKGGFGSIFQKQVARLIAQFWRPCPDAPEVIHTNKPHTQTHTHTHSRTHCGGVTAQWIIQHKASSSFATQGFHDGGGGGKNRTNRHRPHSRDLQQDVQACIPGLPGLAFRGQKKFCLFFLNCLVSQFLRIS